MILHKARMVMSSHTSDVTCHLDAPSLMRLRRHRQLARWRLGRATTRTVRTVYFDTPRHGLWQVGIALSVSMTGQKRVLTVAARDSDGHDLQWETAILSDTPTALTLALLPLAGTVVEGRLVKALSQGLGAIFTRHCHRTVYALRDSHTNPGSPPWEATLWLEHGTQEGVGDTLEIADMRLTTASSAPLYDIARVLTEDCAGLLCLRDHAAQGFERVTAVVARNTAKPLARLRPDHSATHAVKIIAAACLAHVVDHLDRLRVAPLPPPEAIHQVRVGLRRMRSALSLLRSVIQGGEALRAEVAWLAGELAEARDVHILRREIIAPVMGAMPGVAELTRLDEALAAVEQRGLKRVRATLHDPRLLRLLLDWAAWLAEGEGEHVPEDVPEKVADGVIEAVATPMAEPSPPDGPSLLPLAIRVLSKQRGRVLKRGRHFASLAAESRHEVRIDLKKLRYAGEFFSPLWDSKAARAYGVALAGLQESLGALNDVATAQAILTTVAQENPASALAAGMVIGWHRKASESLDDEAIAAWKRFAKCPPYWE